MIWTIIAIVLVIVFFSVFPKIVKESILIKRDSMYTHKNFIFEESVLISEEKLAGYHNKVYIPKHATSENLLSSFMTSCMSDLDSKNEKEDMLYFSCKLRSPLNYKQLLRIKIFDDSSKYINTMHIKYIESVEETSLVLLPTNSKYVMVDIINQSEKYSDNDLLRLDIISKYMKLAELETIFLVFLLFPIAYFVLYFIAGDNLYNYMISNTILLGMGLVISILAINYMIILGWLHMKKRNGVRTYE